MKAIKYNKVGIILLSLSLGIFLGVIIYSFSNLFQTENTQDLVSQGDKYFDKSATGTYNLDKAQEEYQKVLSLDPKNERALYQLARVKYIQSNFKESLELIKKYKNLYPDNKRIHYIAGLVNVYADNLEDSIKEFKLFIDSDLINEAGYLDLAYVYFKKSDFENSKKYLEKGIERFGDNAWLNTSLGITYFNLGNEKKAYIILKKAKEQAKEITPEIWALNYSSNNPDYFQKDIEKFRNLIDFNLELVQGKSYKELSKIKYGTFFETLSKRGLGGGYAVSACCASISGTPCNSESNVCGDINLGTINCAGNSCSARRPRDPPYVGLNTQDVCAGNYFSKIRCGTAETFVGTKVSGVLSPKTNAVCDGVQFLQQRCGESVWTTGIKACSEISGVDETGTNRLVTRTCQELGTCPVSCNQEWQGNKEEVCSGFPLFETKCNQSNLVLGTKSCPGITPPTSIVDSSGEVTNLTNRVIDIQCSKDGVKGWDDCEGVIKLAHKNVPFYLRNVVKSSGNACSKPVNKNRESGALTQPVLRFREEEFNNNLRRYRVNPIGDIPSEVFSKRIEGLCGTDVVIKTIKIKILNISASEN